MERQYGSDKERSVNKGKAWEIFKQYIQDRNTDLDLDYILGRVPLKRDPVLSCGIIEFTIKRNHEDRECAYYHVFRRRNTVEYDTLIKGQAQKNQLFDMLSLLSLDERERILNHSWEELWDDYWIDHNSPSYTSTRSHSESRFLEIRELLEMMNADLPARITKRPYIFPKGKPEKNETGLDAALREAREETGLSFLTGHLYFNSPIVQHYTGSDGYRYSDYYYVWYQNEMSVCPTKKLYNTSSQCHTRSLPILKSASSKEELDPETRNLISKIMPTISPLVDRFYRIPAKDAWSQSPRLRNETISHELESDTWIEIPLFSTTRERLEWMQSINPFQEFGIFRRHFLAIMDIHQHLVGPAA